ncbi:MAG: nuclear transport factor 2 family protein [Nocardioides sp.]|uniref:nuclear transport factor 2 family protein n=1 Tax=Nocardioides sp. TaxID=35761 RepID=UPI0039E5622F
MNAPARIEALEARRRQAMLTGDATTLTEVMHPSCVYVHSSGFIDNGASMAAKVAAGDVRYQSLEFEDEADVSVGDAAVFIYRQRARMLLAGEPHSSYTRCTAVWAPGPDATPRLISFQSAPMETA